MEHIENTHLVILFHGLKDDNPVLSNFYPCNIIYEGKVFKSGEHLYHWMKFQEDDPLYREYQEVIRTANTPYVAKMYGKQETYMKQYT